MTIALGMLASDGVVLAVDGQVTLGEQKLGYGKFHTMAQANMEAGTRGVCVVLGAGTYTNYVYEAMGGVIEAFTEDDSRTDDELRSAISDHLREFYDTHVSNFASYPDRPQIDLIIGYSRNRARDLWHTELGLLGKREVYHATGHGGAFAMQVLDRLYRMPPLDVFQTAMLACYVMFQVKEFDLYCGRHTDLFILKNDAGFHLPRQITAKYEALMENYGRSVEPGAFREAVGSSLSSDHQAVAARTRQLFGDALTEMRSMWEDVHPSTK